MAESRTPGVREVVLIAVLVLAAVFAVEFLSANVPPLGRALGEFPVTIAVLVVGTVVVLLAFAKQPPV